MRSLQTTLFCVLAACEFASGQSASVPAVAGTPNLSTSRRVPPTARQNQIGTIRHLMSEPSPLRPATVVQLGRGGDRVAADILTILSTRAPLTAAEEYTVVDMLHKAFENPLAIGSNANLVPTKTLALLQSIANATTDFTLRTQIADTQTFVQNVKVIPPPQPTTPAAMMKKMPFEATFNPATDIVQPSN
jgi:hypothetical protein